MNALFKDPLWLLWAALAAAAMAGVAAWSAARRRRLLALFAEPGLLELLVPGSPGKERAAAAALRAACVLCLGVALAGPRWGIELVKSEHQGVHAVVAVDVSASMSAQDLKPDRLTRAKLALSSLLDDLRGQRVGLVAFSGSAAVQCPLTTDIAAARLFLQAMRPGMLPDPGTSLGDAIRLGTKMLAPYPGRKGLVLLTDGEDQGSDPVAAAREAKEAGVEIHAVGLGSTEGEPIPERDAAGNITGYRRDASGKVALTRLDEATLAEVARVTGGTYIRPSASGAELAEAAARLKSLDRSRLAQGAAERYRDRTRVPLALAFLFLLAEALLPLLRGGRSRAAGPALALLLLAPAAQAGQAEDAIRKGTRLLDAGRPTEAAAAFSAGRAGAPDDQRLPYNEGVALSAAGDHEAAAAAFGRAAAMPGGLTRDAWYNRGNALFQAGKSEEAVQAYRRALLTDMSDDEARENLQVALTRRRDQQKPQSKPDEKKPEEREQDQEKGGDDQKEGGKRDRGMSQEDAQRILEALKEKERANFRGEEYDRAGKLAKPGRGGKGNDW